TTRANSSSNSIIRSNARWSVTSRQADGAIRRPGDMRIRSDSAATSIDAAAVTGNFRRLGRALTVMILCASFVGLFATNGRADDPSAIAAQLSDGAFAMLKSLNAQNSGGASSPMLGPVASFAGDAQTLSHALANGDRDAASNALGQLQSDPSAVARALGEHPDGPND